LIFSRIKIIKVSDEDISVTFRNDIQKKASIFIWIYKSYYMLSEENRFISIISTLSRIEFFNYLSCLNHDITRITKKVCFFSTFVLVESI